MLQGHKCQSKMLARTNLEFAFLEFPLQKSCKSVVSPYIFTVNILFLILDTEGSEKYSFVGMWGCMVDPSGPRPNTFSLFQ